MNEIRCALYRGETLVLRISCEHAGVDYHYQYVTHPNECEEEIFERMAEGLRYTIGDGTRYPGPIWTTDIKLISKVEDGTENVPEPINIFVRTWRWWSSLFK